MTRPSAGMSVNSDEAILAGLARKILRDANYVGVFDDECEIDVRVYLTDDEKRIVNKYV